MRSIAKCGDGSKPTCADGSKPQRVKGQPPCAEGRPKTCADGSTPSRPVKPNLPSLLEGKKCPRKDRVCCDGTQLSGQGRRPRCDDGQKPVCPDQC